jgi:hypothetical protein
MHVQRDSFAPKHTHIQHTPTCAGDSRILTHIYTHVHPCMRRTRGRSWSYSKRGAKQGRLLIIEKSQILVVRIHCVSVWPRTHARLMCVSLLARAGSWVLDAILQPGSSVSSGTLSFLDKVQAHTLIAHPINIVCVYIYMCMCVFVCVCTLHRRPGAHSLSHMLCVCVCVCIYMCMCVRVYSTQTPGRSYLTPYVVCVYIYMCVCVHYTDAHVLIAYPMYNNI